MRTIVHIFEFLIGVTLGFVLITAATSYALAQLNPQPITNNSNTERQVYTVKGTTIIIDHNNVQVLTDSDK